MELLTTTTFKHPVRIIGFGQVASRFINYMDEIEADKVVFRSEVSENEQGPQIMERDNYIEVRLNRSISSPKPNPAIAQIVVRMINEHNLFAPIAEGAKHVIFVSALPSVSSYVLYEIAKGLVDNPSFSTIRTSAFLQLPFSFEGKKRCDEAMRLAQAIKENMSYTEAYDIDSVMKIDGYRQLSIEDNFKRCDKEMAQRIIAYLGRTGD